MKIPPHLESLDVAIVGGGVAGLASAVALQTIAGVCSTIYEADSGMRKGGFGLALCPNGLRALHHMDIGMHDEVVRSGSVVTERFFTTCESTRIHYCNERAEYGHPMLCVRFLSLHNALRKSALLHGCRIVSGTVCEGLHPAPTLPKPPPPRLLLGAEGGEGEGEGDRREEAVTAGLVIGADGLRSVVRRQLGDTMPPRDAGVVWFMGIVAHASCSLLHRSRVHQFLLEDPTKVASLMPVGDHTYWAVALAGAVDQEEAMEIGDSHSEMQSYLESKFAECDALVELLRATPRHQIHRHRIQDRPAIPSFVQGSVPGESRIALVGDAAHPMRPSLGQGANTALEDAVQLALLLRDASSVEEALREYDKARVDRCAMLQGDSDFVARRAYQDRGGGEGGEETKRGRGGGGGGGEGDEERKGRWPNQSMGSRDYVYNWEPVRL
ncbi:unnamed protein product, partial [Discosporangium mesarthrocarpum]